MTTTAASQVLNDIYTQRQTAPLSILSLADPILNPEPQTLPQTPSSQSQSQLSVSQNGSNATNTTILTPSTLAVDLEHYRDLFSKLRFSYLEQVTKEKYLKNLIGEPPTLATPEQNAQLEEKLVVMKAELQTKKRGVDALVVEMEQLAREIAEKYDIVEAGMRQLETLPREVEGLEQEVEELRRQLREKEGEMEISSDPRMNLSLEETQMLVQEQRRRQEGLRGQLDTFERELPAKMRECEKAERELVEIETRRNEVTRTARDALRRKAEGKPDLLEQQGRWYKSSEVVLKGLLGVED
ncbi:hypothetical protein LTR64_004271 [Lithohypha guttulata]|uniref:uncharacterized protein n=1 Tax=Lithohypha guttulata TaxID=1690604 RepID=UPI002DE04CCE|nr:hypothetical protein LTR51_006434 [Lithohypha guttulata]